MRVQKTKKKEKKNPTDLAYVAENKSILCESPCLFVRTFCQANLETRCSDICFSQQGVLQVARHLARSHGQYELGKGLVVNDASLNE